MLSEGGNHRGFVFPGQGTQKTGMSEVLISNRNPEIRTLVGRTYEEADDILNINLTGMCIHGPDSELDKTEIAQPAVLVASIAALRALHYYDLVPNSETDIVAGHSLGEYSALVAAEALSFAQAVRLVSSRGRFMELAGNKNPGGMAAILGLGLSEVEAICCESGAEIANINNDLQVVVSGPHDSISYVVKKLGDRKVRQLKVSIAAHSSLMTPAKQNMELLLEHECIQPPNLPFIQNVTGNYVQTVSQVKRGLIEQLTGRVLWLDTINLMHKDGVGEYIEVGPGEVLTKIIRRIDPRSIFQRSDEVLT